MEPDPLSTPALDAYRRRTETPLDLLALFTIWLTVLPFTGATDTSGFTWWVAGRLALSVVYGIDLWIRARLSKHRLRYLRTHPLALAVVLVPTVRIVFSVRLLSSMFRKGALDRFLFVALVLFLNGVIMVYTFEVDAAGSNIHTFGESLWWAAVTVATVGYGDYYPVTPGGRVTAVGLMVIGLITAAVVTAQIASTFMDQANARRATAAPPRTSGLRGRVARALAEPPPAEDSAAGSSEAAPAPSGPSDRPAAVPAAPAAETSTSVSSAFISDLSGAASIAARLDRIEQLLLARTGDDEADPGT